MGNASRPVRRAHLEPFLSINTNILQFNFNHVEVISALAVICFNCVASGRMIYDMCAVLDV